MKKLLIGITAFTAAVLLFTGGVYASQWLDFTGDKQITQADSDVDEIMEILRKLNTDKITAEEALAKLQGVDTDRLTQIETLEDDVAKLKGTVEMRERDISGLKEQLESAGDPEYITHLEEQLTIANNAVEQHSITTTEAVQEARTYQNDEQ